MIAHLLFTTIINLIVRVEEAVSIELMLTFSTLFFGKEVDSMNYNKFVYSSKFKSVNELCEDYSSDLVPSKTSMSNLSKREV